MSILTTRIQKVIVFLASTLTISMMSMSANAVSGVSGTAGVSGTNSLGAGSGAGSGAGAGGGALGGGDAITLLAEIAQYTNGTLQAVNNLPQYMTDLAQLAIAWLTPDTSTPTATLQGLLNTYSSAMLTSTNNQLSMQQQITQDFFGANVTTTTVPYANDLAFETVLGSPYFSPDPRNQQGQGQGQTPAVNPALNYIENAGAIGMSHAVPSGSWTGNQDDQSKYATYYRAVNAIQTYDFYVMSEIYTDANAGLTQAQTQLLSQASTSSWFAQIASEQIGIVLRQLLMYNSQTFVVLSQLLQTQKELLMGQAMNNTLLILQSSTSEGMMLRKAQQKS